MVPGVEMFPFAASVAVAEGVWIKVVPPPVTSAVLVRLPAPTTVTVPPPAGGSVVWISEAWLAPRAVPYGCPDFPGYYCPRRPAAPMPAPGEEALLDEAAALPTPVAAKVATAGGLGALILVGLAAGGVFGG